MSTNPYTVRDFNEHDDDFINEVEAISTARSIKAYQSKPVNISDRAQIKKPVPPLNLSNVKSDNTVDDALLEEYGEKLHKLSRAVAKLESNFESCKHRLKVSYDASAVKSARLKERSNSARDYTGKTHAVVTPEKHKVQSHLKTNSPIHAWKNGGKNSKKTNSKSKKLLKRTSNRKRKSSYNKTHKRA